MAPRIVARTGHDTTGKPTARHMIFLTDGETQALDGDLWPLWRRAPQPAALGPGRSFEVANSAELSEVFSKIAESLGDLRISK